MTLLERIIEYAKSPLVIPRGLCMSRMEVGKVTMQRLSREVFELTGVALGALPDSISYKGVLIVYDDSTGTERVDAVWEDRYLTRAGAQLADEVAK